MITLNKNSLKYKDFYGNMRDSGVLFASDAKKKWEHVETIITEEDNVSRISRSQEPDGTPYNFKKMIVFVYHPLYTGEKDGRTGILVNASEMPTGSSIYLTSNQMQLNTKYPTDTIYQVEVVKDILIGNSACVLEPSVNYDTSYTMTGNFVPRKIAKIDSIKKNRLCEFE